MTKTVGDTTGNTIFPMDSLRNIPRSAFEYIWRLASKDASVDEFDGPSFLGGMCIGTAACVILGKIFRSLFLIATGGIVTTVLLKHYGAISVDYNSMKSFLHQSVTGGQLKVQSAFQGVERFLVFLSRNLFWEDIPRGHVISGLMGTAAGFCLGIIAF